MKLGDFLNKMASKTGKQNSKELIDILSRQDINQIDIPDELANSIDSELMSLEGAKNNSNVKAHYVALALNGVDTELANAVNEFNLDSALFSSEKDTYGKLRTLKTKLKELMDQKPDGKGELEKERSEWQKKYNEINAKMAEMVESHTKVLSSTKEEYDNKVLNFLKINHLKGFNYADKERPLDVQAKLAQLLIEDALTKSNAKVINDNDSLKLKLASDPSLDYFDESHKQVAYDDFVKKVLADNKMLAVSDPNGKGNIPPAHQTIFPNTIGGGNQTNTAKFDAAMAQSLADLNQNK